MIATPRKGLRQHFGLENPTLKEEGIARVCEPCPILRIPNSDDTEGPGLITGDTLSRDALQAACQSSAAQDNFNAQTARVVGT